MTEDLIDYLEVLRMTIEGLINHWNVDTSTTKGMIDHWDVDTMTTTECLTDPWETGRSLRGPLRRVCYISGR